MAGKGNRRVRKGSRKAVAENKFDLFLQRLFYDILSVALPLCGLPKEKLKCKERKENTYSETYYEFKVCLVVLKIALSKRDEWKTMFESRFKNAGKDMLVTINDFLKKFLFVSRQFRQSNTMNKVNISLAAYSEMILFLNYKDIEFDFELMIVSFNNIYNELIAPHEKTSEPDQELFPFPNDPFSVFKFINFFLKEEAIPYGCTDEISGTFLECYDELIRKQKEEALENARRAHFASQLTTAAASEDSDLILPPGFDSPAVLPGDRESPEPSEVCSTEDDGKDRRPRIRYYLPVWPRDFVSPPVLKEKFRSPDQPYHSSARSGVRGKDKKSRKPSAKPVEPLGVETPVLSDKGNFPEPPESCITESGSKDEVSSMLPHFNPRTTDAAAARETDPILPSGSESSEVLIGDRESSEKPEDRSTQSGARAKDKPRIRYPRPVVPGFRSLVVLPDESNFPEPPESCITEIGIKDEESSMLPHFIPLATDAAAARETDPISPSGSGSSEVIIGDRESSEKPDDSSTQTGARVKDEKPRIRYPRSVVPEGFGYLVLLPDESNFLDSPESYITESGGSGDEESSMLTHFTPHTADTAAARETDPFLPTGSEPSDVPPGDVESPDKVKSPEPPESGVTASGGSEKDEESSVPSTGSKDVKVRRRTRTEVRVLLERFRKMKLDPRQENEPKD